MAIDIYNAESGNTVIKHGTLLVVVPPAIIEKDNTNVKHTPSITDIDDKYTNDFKAT